MKKVFFVLKFLCVFFSIFSQVMAIFTAFAACCKAVDQFTAVVFSFVFLILSFFLLFLECVFEYLIKRW